MVSTPSVRRPMPAEPRQMPRPHRPCESSSTAPSGSLRCRDSAPIGLYAGASILGAHHRVERRAHQEIIQSWPWSWPSCLVLGARPEAHEVPNEVTVLTFLKPEGKTLTLLVRAPLKSMRDIDVPVQGANGFLDFSRVDTALEARGHAVDPRFRRGLRERRPARRRRAWPATRVSLPSDRSFEDYDTAYAYVMTGPRLAADTQIYWEQGMLDVAFEYPIDVRSLGFLDSAWPHPAGHSRQRGAALLAAGRSGARVRRARRHGLVRLDPQWYQAFWLFVKEGFFHILDGTDHLLFLLCLVIPFRQFRALVVVVTSFTIAHSVTLIASAFGLAPSGLWFPPLIETLIAVSIVYMAFENIVGAKLGRRWMVTFGFGLVHGFGFSFVLQRTAAVCGLSPAGVAAGVQRGCRARPVAGAADCNSSAARCSSGSSSPSGWARSCSRPWWRTRPGTGRSIAAPRSACTGSRPSTSPAPPRRCGWRWW